MMDIVTSGGMSSVQDLGRMNYRRLGVGVAGANDTLAARIGNTMLRNQDNAAFIEIMLFPFRVRFTEDTCIAITGANTHATLDGAALSPWWCLSVKAGQLLQMNPPEFGGTAYLCIEHGIDVPVVLGSRSTDLKAHFGGHEGRLLRKGDHLRALATSSRQKPTSFGVRPPADIPQLHVSSNNDATVVRVLPATEWDNYAQKTIDTFLSHNWTISPNSNRIGMRLEGPALLPIKKLELLSHGIVPGLIQVPPSGQPIVMQADAQTSGGYPKIATVIEADQWKVAQTPLRGKLRFHLCTLAEARQALQRVQQYQADIRNVIALVN
jgi:biotin-dependent carboxylase-like uncharacterized protein